MKADLAKLRALQQEMRERAVACIDVADAVAMHRFADRLDDLPELLAIAEAVERAPVVELVLRDDDRGNDWLECRHVADWSTMNALDGQRVRLLAIGEDG
jgi:hypothetical protein